MEISEFVKTILVPLITTAITLIGGGYLTYRGIVKKLEAEKVNREADANKTDAESKQIERQASNTIVGSAGTLVERFSEALDEERAFRISSVNELREEIKQIKASNESESEKLREEIKKERSLRQAAAEKCAADIERERQARRELQATIESESSQRKKLQEENDRLKAEIRILKSRLTRQGKDISDLKTKKDTGDLPTPSDPHDIPPDAR